MDIQSSAIIPSCAPLSTPPTPRPAPPSSGSTRRSAPPRAADGPLAVLRSGKETGTVGFDRIVWRENARLSPLPPRLYPVEEVLGGIVGIDNQVTLVLHPAAVMRRLRLIGASDRVDAAAPAAGADA